MKTAIVVDDSRAIRMILGRTLRELGFTVSEAENGREALDLMQANPGRFELALLDWNMPEMNGMELLLALRADPRFRELVIVMVTTETELNCMATAMDAGASEYVMKPFTREILVEKLQIAGVPV